MDKKISQFAMAFIYTHIYIFIYIYICMFYIPWARMKANLVVIMLKLDVHRKVDGESGE